MSKLEFRSAQEWRDASLEQCRAFLEAFPLEKLSELTLDDYIIGKGAQTFCWWLEIGTGKYAAINGAWADKFGVFHSKKGTLQVANHLKSFSSQKVFERAKSFILEVAKTAASRDLDGLIKLAKKPAKERCIKPIVLWKVAELYQPVDSPFLLPVCGTDAVETLGEKNAGTMQQRFQTFLPDKDYWERCWEFMKPLRVEKGFVESDNDDEDESDAEPAEYARLLRILRSRKNLILQGAPGTGKTYLIPELVTRLCGVISGPADRKDVLDAYKRLTEDGRVVAVTFHPSMDYDDFVQGWKPDPNADQKDGIKMKLTDGVFKRLCDLAGVRGLNEIRDGATVWKVTPDSSKPNPVRDDCLRNNRIRIGWEDDDENHQVKDFRDEMQIGDIVFSRFGKQYADAIGVVTGEHEMLDGETAKLGRCRSRSVKWLYKGEPVDITSINGGCNFRVQTVDRMPNANASQVRTFLRTLLERPYVFVIDEFNRGNVPKIFGELITLIEADKREGESEEMSVHLAYDAPDALAFTVPSNVYILGTMNTADRSIAPIDYAMRRRFAFERILPHEIAADENFDFNLFDAVSQLFVKDPKDPVDRSEHLSEEFDPADVWIGHSYFLTPGGESSLSRWKSEILPLLNEYLRDGVLNPSAREEIWKIEQTLAQRE